MRDKLVKVAARFTDEVWGYDRWVADQVGAGDRFAALHLFDTEAERDDWIRTHGGEQ